MKADQKGRLGASLLLLLAAACVNAQQHPPQEAPKAHTEPVVLTVTVVNEKFQALPGLQPSNFGVFENKVAQTISSVSSRDEPISVGILFDASRSMGAGSRPASTLKLQILTDALARFLEHSNPSNEYFVLGFSAHPGAPLDWTSDRQAVIGKLRSFGAKGETALYDACYLGIQKVMEGRYSKRVILLISDGQDNNSRRKLSEVRELLKESSVLLYSVGVHDLAEDGSHLNPGNGPILDELSSISGGWAFFPRLGAKFKGAEIIGAFEVIAQHLHNQYTLSFAPAPSTGKKKWHKIKVKVSAPANASREMKNLHVRAREGYYQY